MPHIAHGTRDDSGAWHADRPEDYPPMDVHGTLPWSVLRQDARAWQDRKAWWKTTHELGVPIGRESAAGMMRTGRHGSLAGGVSVFDPHLAECLATWYCPPGGLILDPCAGGPERAAVATALGYRYHGIDPAGPPTADAPGTWITGYAQHGLHLPDQSADMVLACPPYHDRERYSDHPDDLSAMTWGDYLTALDEIVSLTVAAMRVDRFAAWVISDVRDSHGHLRRLPHRLADMLTSHGLSLIAEHVLVAPVGTAHKRMRRPWETCRTPTRVHQIVHVAVKGSRQAATRRIAC